MAKRAPRVNETASLSAAARIVGVSKGALSHAIKTRQVETCEDAGGDVRVVVASAETWSKTERRPGRKPSGSS